MNSLPKAAAPVVPLANGVSALSTGLLWLHDSKALVAADVHFAYEDVIGGALPVWSTGETLRTLLESIAAMNAREVVLLGDVIHGSRMSEGAARTVRDALDALRAAATLTIVAGNHEGKTRGAAILGETVEDAQRDGWLLLHGDKPPSLSEFAAARGAIIGHLHPSLRLGRSTSAPAFLAADRVIVVPALTPYSSGLDVRSDACLQALRPFNVAKRRELRVFVAAGGLCYPFGTLSMLRSALSST